MRTRIEQIEINAIVSTVRRAVQRGLITHNAGMQEVRYRLTKLAWWKHEV